MFRVRPDRDPTRPVYVISVAAGIVRVHPRTLRIYEDEGLISARRARPRTSASTRTTTSDAILWIRHLTQNLGVNLAGIRILFELEEKLQMPILEALYNEPLRPARRTRTDPTHDHRDAGGATPGGPPSPPRRR